MILPKSDNYELVTWWTISVDMVKNIASKQLKSGVIP
jgi:hypothetical protein